jgi:hypothetical protein
MYEFLKSLLTAQPGALLILFGMVLLLLAIIGAVQGKIVLDRRARLIGGALGLISLTFGVWLQTHIARTIATPQVQPSPNSSHGVSASGDATKKEDNKAGAGSTTKAVHPLNQAKQKPAPTTSTPSQHDAGGQLAPWPSNTTPAGESPRQTCRINPKPWRWTTTGRLLVEVDDQNVGTIDVGKKQTGFDFKCSPGDHKYRVHSDTMQVDCTGAVVFETSATTLDLVFSQTSPGPPDCSLASVR